MTIFQNFSRVKQDNDILRGVSEIIDKHSSVEELLARISQNETNNADLIKIRSYLEGCVKLFNRFSGVKTSVIQHIHDDFKNIDPAVLSGNMKEKQYRIQIWDREDMIQNLNQ